MPSSRPPFVVRSTDVPEHEAAYPAPFDAEKLAIGRDLGRAAGSRSLGMWRERLLPGRRTSFTHAHLREEELVYVLTGRPTLRWIPVGEEARECELEPGDVVAFPAGTGIAHTVVNRSDTEAELLVVGERRVGEQACYPEDTAFAAWRAERAPERAWADYAGPTGQGRLPFARIETERLVLRPWQPSETAALVALIRQNHAHLSRWIPRAAEMHALDEQLALVLTWQKRMLEGDLILGMFEPDGAPIGNVGLHNRVGTLGREISYWVAEPKEGKGFVTEAVSALVRVGFELLGLDRLEIQCDPGNTRSWSVAARLGFEHEATLPRRAVGAGGEPADSMVWSLYRSKWGAPKSPVRVLDMVGRRLL